MDKSKNEPQEFYEKEVVFPLSYKKRSNNDLFKLLIIENRKSLRGFKIFSPIAIFLILIWLVTTNTIVLIVMIPFAALLIISIIEYVNIWRIQRKWEKEQLLKRIFVKERILKYGDVGIHFQEDGKHGFSQEKHTWDKFGVIVEWEKSLFLINKNTEGIAFVINEEEIGQEFFFKFRDFAKSKLNYKLITNFKEVINPKNSST